MATTFPRVSPGEVITADKWNQVLGALEDLYSQIGAVSNTQVSITGFIPPGPVKVGDQVTIQGRNFQYSIGAQLVYFAGAPVSTYLLGSSDTQLVVNVPNITNIPAQGQPVTVTVYNRTSNDTKQITVVPLPIPVIGSVPVSAVPFTGTPTAGQSASFSFVATSNLSVTRALNFTATVTPAAWQGFVQLQSTGGQPLGQITLAPNGSVPVIAVLAIPGSAAANTPFTIQIDAIDVTDGNNVGSSGTANYAVGVASQVDPNVQFGALTLVDASPNQFGALSGSKITLPANTYATIQVETSFKAAAQYSVTATLTNATGWQVTMLDPPVGQNLDYRAGVPPSTTVTFKVQALAAPTSGGQLQVQGQTVGQNLITSLGFSLAAA